MNSNLNSNLNSNHATIVKNRISQNQQREGQKIIYFTPEISKRSMRHKAIIALGIIVMLLLVLLGTSVVTASTEQETKTDINTDINTDMGTTLKNNLENDSTQEIRYKYYTSVYVTRGMTLWDIAQEYATEEYTDKRAYINEVIKINHLSSDRIVYGSTICVPYYSSEYK